MGSEWKGSSRPRGSQESERSPDLRASALSCEGPRRGHRGGRTQGLAGLRGQRTESVGQLAAKRKAEPRSRVLLRWEGPFCLETSVRCYSTVLTSSGGDPGSLVSGAVKRPGKTADRNLPFLGGLNKAAKSPASSAGSLTFSPALVTEPISKPSSC